MRDIHGILYLIRNGSVIFLGKIESPKRVLCFEMGRRAVKSEFSPIWEHKSHMTKWYAHTSWEADGI